METSQITKKVWITVLMTLGVGVSLYFAYRFYDQYAISKSKLDQLREVEAQLQHQLDTTTDFVQSYDQRQPDSGTLALALPSGESDMTNFVASIGDLAAASGVAISGFSISEPNTTQATPYTIQLVNLNFTIAGSYPAFKNFVLRLENHLRLIDVSSLNINVLEGGSGQYQLSLRTYYQK